jgi:hypothetical protein
MSGVMGEANKHKSTGEVRPKTGIDTFSRQK